MAPTQLHGNVHGLCASASSFQPSAGSSPDPVFPKAETKPKHKAKPDFQPSVAQLERELRNMQPAYIPVPAPAQSKGKASSQPLFSHDDDSPRPALAVPKMPMPSSPPSKPSQSHASEPPVSYGGQCIEPDPWLHAPRQLPIPPKPALAVAADAWANWQPTMHSQFVSEEVRQAMIANGQLDAHQHIGNPIQTTFEPNSQQHSTPNIFQGVFSSFPRTGPLHHPSSSTTHSGHPSSPPGFFQSSPSGRFPGGASQYSDRQGSSDYHSAHSGLSRARANFQSHVFGTPEFGNTHHDMSVAHSSQARASGSGGCLGKLATEQENLLLRTTFTCKLACTCHDMSRHATSRYL